MKNRLLTIIGVAALALAAVQTVKAQTPTYSLQSWSTFTNISSPSATLNVPSTLAATIDVSRSQVVALSVSGSTLGSVGATNAFLFAPSVDSINYDTNLANLFSITNTIKSGSANTNTFTKLITVGGYQSLKLFQIITVADATSGGMTNAPSGTAGLKISSP